MTAPTLAALAGGLALLLAGLRAWWRRRADARAITRLEVDVAQAKGQRDVAVATVEVARDVAADQAAGRADGEAVRGEASASGPNPLDRIRAADRVRAKIAALRRDQVAGGEAQSAAAAAATMAIFDIQANAASKPANR